MVDLGTPLKSSGGQNGTQQRSSGAQKGLAQSAWSYYWESMVESIYLLMHFGRLLVPFWYSRTRVGGSPRRRFAQKGGLVQKVENWKSWCFFYVEIKKYIMEFRTCRIESVETETVKNKCLNLWRLEWRCFYIVMIEDLNFEQKGTFRKIEVLEVGIELFLLWTKGWCAAFEKRRRR